MSGQSRLCWIFPRREWVMASIVYRYQGVTQKNVTKSASHCGNRHVVVDILGDAVGAGRAGCQAGAVGYFDVS